MSDWSSNLITESNSIGTDRRDRRIQEQDPGSGSTTSGAAIARRPSPGMFRHQQVGLADQTG
jgi:hypothetical protein